MISDSLRQELHSAKSAIDKPPVLIYFICGNPGLIAFYEDFFRRLRAHLEAQDGGQNYILYGKSLRGFETRTKNLSYAKAPPYTLQQQIANVREDLLSFIAASTSKYFRHTTTTTTANDPHLHDLPVILIGHSVGSYILLELLASLKNHQTPHTIIAGICLFPTITHLSHSPRGTLLTPFLTHLPALSYTAHLLAKLLCSVVLPTTWLESIVQRVTGLPAHAVEIVTAFLQSPTGVYSSLFLAKYELQEMQEDKWDEELWGGSISAGTNRPELFFYWGEDDYWVDKSIRDHLIASRAKRGQGKGEEGKPVMEIDALGVPHDFCIRHSEPVAAKVAGYIGEVIGTLAN